ncbi:MAG TPA: tetratricopeptide repeat protein [Acidobacteriota bacterium]|jgi:tetratricopeptide (TPR) repeat protein
MKKAKAPARQSKKKTSSAKKKPTSFPKKVSTAAALKSRVLPISAKSAQKTTARAAKVKVAASGEKALAARRKDEKALLDLYERGIKALYSKNYQHAMDLFERLIENYPEEIELTDRARNFIKISLSQGATRKQHHPKTAEEMFDVGVIEHNKANFQRAIEYFQTAIQADPKADYIHYALAASHAQAGDIELAIRNLEKSIQLNPENKFLARNDPDFEPIRASKEFTAVIEAPRAE